MCYLSCIWHIEVVGILHRSGRTGISVFWLLPCLALLVFLFLVLVVEWFYVGGGSGLTELWLLYFCCSFLFDLLWNNSRFAIVVFCCDLIVLVRIGLCIPNNSNLQLLQIKEVCWAADIFSWKISWFWWYFFGLSAIKLQMNLVVGAWINSVSFR